MAVVPWLKLSWSWSRILMNLKSAIFKIFFLVPMRYVNSPFCQLVLYQVELVPRIIAVRCLASNSYSHSCRHERDLGHLGILGAMEPIFFCWRVA